MRTVNKVGGANGTIFTEFYGNTTDVKPTEDVPNGSAFYEVDNNMQEYRFDKENKIWYPITRGGTAPSDEYLPLSGGIMTGDINMNGNSLLNAKSITLKDETGEYTVALNLVHLETTNPETGEPFSYEVIEFSNSDDTTKQYVITGVADPLSDTDVVNLRYLGNNYIPLTGTKENKPVTGVVTFNGESTITGVSTPVNDTDVVTKKYVDDSISSVTENQVTIQKADNANMRINLTVNGDEASGILDLSDKNGNPVIVRGVDTPVQDTDAVNKKYFETHLPSDFVPNKDLDMKQYKLINTSAVEIYGGINDSADNTYFIRETSQASINTDTKVPEYVKVITGVHTGDTNQDVILRGIRAGQQKNDAVNYEQFKTLADSFERCQHDVESLNAWKMTFDESQVANTVNSIIKYTDVAYELTIASGEEQWYSYDLAMQTGYTPISATLVINDTNPFVGHCSLDITPDGTYNALIYLKAQGDDKTCNCKVRLVWIKN